MYVIMDLMMKKHFENQPYRLKLEAKITNFRQKYCGQIHYFQYLDCLIYGLDTCTYFDIFLQLHCTILHEKY